MTVRSLFVPGTWRLRWPGSTFGVGALALGLSVGCTEARDAAVASQIRTELLLESASSLPQPLARHAQRARGGTLREDRPGNPPHEGELPALDSHRTALERQLLAGWGEQSDRDGQAGFPLVDSGNWRRVRFRGVPTFTAFTYGSDHNAITSAFAVPVSGTPTSRKCMALFEARANEEFDALGGRRGQISERKGRFRDEELLIHSADGQLEMLFTTYRFSVAWAAYPGYSNGCIVYSTVFLWGDEPKLARKVRDRWVREGFERYVARTPELPYRH